jgi:hypothetical protein
MTMAGKSGTRIPYRYAKRCDECGQPYVAKRIDQRWCSVHCSAVYHGRKRYQKEKRERIERTLKELRK